MWDMRNTEGGMRDEIAWRDWDALISIGGMRDSFEIDGGIWDLNSEWPFENLTRQDWHRESESGGMAGWSQN